MSACVPEPVHRRPLHEGHARGSSLRLFAKICDLLHDNDIKVSPVNSLFFLFCGLLIPRSKSLIRRGSSPQRVTAFPGLNIYQRGHRFAQC